jgi:hypothetical protein
MRPVPGFHLTKAAERGQANEALGNHHDRQMARQAPNYRGRSGSD